MNSYQDFIDSLNEVQLLLEESKSAFESADNSKTPSERLSYLKKGNAFSRSGIVLLCGHFEGFLKNLTSEFIDEFNDSCLLLELAPFSLFEIAMIQGLNKARSGTLENQKDLRDMIFGRTPVRVKNDKSFSTESNPKVAVIDKILRQLDINDIVETLSVKDFGLTTYASKSQVDHVTRSKIRKAIESNASGHVDALSIESIVCQLIDEKWRPKKERREVGYVATIQRLLVKRNLIAHGQDNVQITSLELEGFLNEINDLAKGISDVISHKIQSIKDSSSCTIPLSDT